MVGACVCECAKQGLYWRMRNLRVTNTAALLSTVEGALMLPTQDVGGLPLDQLQRENGFLGLTWGPSSGTCALHGGRAGVNLFCLD